ncbi:MAG: NfeD family protein [Lachnospiraceae bacterium]|nr:NfeD family protein [Lachnospiraceae bacterium]
MNSLYVWLGIFVLAVIIEVATAGLATVWFACGAFVAFILAVLKVDIVWQVVAFVVVSLVLLAFTRPMAKKYLNRKTEKTNVLDKIIGRTALVTEEINNILATGKVTVDGMPWTARSADPDGIIPVGKEVVIEQLVGVKLIVKALESKIEELSPAEEEPAQSKEEE